MAVVYTDAQTLAEATQTVGGESGYDLSGKAYRANALQRHLIAALGEVMGKKLKVEVYIVCNKYFIMKELHNHGCQLIERRGILQHFVADAGKALNENGNFLPGMNQGGESLFDPLPVTYHNGYLRNVMLCGLSPGGFDIYNGKIQIKELFLNVKIRA